jgi:nicotinamide mononucleotide transporter
MISSEILSVHTILWIFGSYELSLIELLATVLGLWSFIQIVRRKISGLVIGVFSTSITAVLFYQVRLYSDMMLMMFYLGVALTAIWTWQRNRRSHGGQVCVSRLSLKRLIILALGMMAAVASLRYISSHLNIWLPTLFPEPAAFAWADASTTVLGITASILLIRQQSECMVFWLVSDIISTVVYQKSGVYFLSGVYIIYLFCDAYGAVAWARCPVPKGDSAV